ncbi:MAG: ribosome-binding factor A [Deltaproteobacteria bacterium RIFCSPHIGHO2_02_FULL_40_11]|nr:MAG: ribosome-binding factor A [Deltaproteobacteria bacterium RIFCSPHIGHO2_02_FULL_40_11]
MTTRRQQKVSELIRNVISQLLIERGVHSTGIHGLITVTKVSMTPDLKWAKVYVSNMSSSEEQSQTIQALNEEKKMVQSTIGRELKLRFTPHVEFILDTSLDYSDRIDELLKGEKKNNE